jgi:two-component system sensor histidine kinase DesK
LPKNQDWTAYVWLVYLGYFLIMPWLIGAPTWVRLATVLGTLAGLPLYFLGYWLCGRRVLWVVGGFTLLGTLFAPINPGAATLFIFAATALAGIGDPPKAFPYLGVLLAVVALEAWLLKLPPIFWITTMFFSSRSCWRRRRRANTWPRSQSASGSHAICTTCWGIRCR